MTTATGGVIYGVRLPSSYDYRYVGPTTKSADIRLRQHLKVAAGGRKTAFYDWLRKQDRAEVIADTLDWVEGLDDLGRAEITWIAYLRRDGQPLLNLSAASDPPALCGPRRCGKPHAFAPLGGPVSRYAEENPFHGRKHSAEQREKWSIERKGTNSGADNPNFGKFGEEHPGYGHSMSEESRARMSEQRRGAGNPNFGKTASDETRAKMSAARKGRPMPSSRRNAHTRHHTNKGVVKDTCQYCIEDAGKTIEE